MNKAIVFCIFALWQIGVTKMIDKIKPGTVNWKIVELKALKNPFKVGVNCQEVIDASKRSGYKIINIGNKDIYVIIKSTTTAIKILNNTILNTG